MPIVNGDCKFIVKSALLLHCFEIILLGFYTFSSHVNEMSQTLALEILRDVAHYFLWVLDHFLSLFLNHSHLMKMKVFSNLIICTLEIKSLKGIS